MWIYERFGHLTPIGGGMSGDEKFMVEGLWRRLFLRVSDGAEYQAKRA